MTLPITLPVHTFTVKRDDGEDIDVLTTSVQPAGRTACDRDLGVRLEFGPWDGVSIDGNAACVAITVDDRSGDPDIGWIEIDEPDVIDRLIVHLQEARDTLARVQTGEQP